LIRLMTTQSDLDVASLMTAYRDAVGVKDIEAFLALFTEDVRCFDLWTEWEYQGIDAWRKMVEGWFEAVGSDCDRVGFEAVDTVVSGDLAVVQALVRFTAVSAEGVDLRSMQERLTWTLRRVDGAWKIAHQHTSVPVSSETFKMIYRA
jgi:uncharacterized protein (TIGR02246 family)